ncbi:MAG: tetratricopeptide repeat protein [Ferruginibacter sp.]|nr:tetratricopeptide repeat protein [Ferruginibacter sp.]
MDNVQNILNKLQTLKNDGDHEGINKLLSDELLQQYNNACLYTWKASACNSNKDFVNAFRYAEQAIIIETGDRNSYFQRAIALYMLRDYEAAIKDLNMVLEPSGSELAFLCRAECWYGISEFDNAVTDFSRAISINSSNKLSYYERGLCKTNLGRYDAAIKDFDKAIEVESDYHQAYCDKGLACFMLQKYDEALANFDKCLELDKTYTIAYYNKGLYYYRIKDYKKAVENYTNAIEKDNASLLVDIRANAYNNRGNIYMLWELQDEAIADFDNALKINPAMGETYLNRGMIWQQRSDYDKAKKDFTRSFEILKANEQANKAYLIFLEDQIKLCDEKRAETDNLSRTLAKDEDKRQFSDTGKKLDELIDCISKAAKSQVKAVVHYTKLFVADIYVKSFNSKMNYSNAIYMNDPNEGKILLKYLNDPEIKQAFENGEKLSELSVYIGSFLPANDGKTEAGHNDELIMWRTYGRDGEGNEACGCSIIIESTFFKPPVSMDKQVTGENADMLCKVIYIKDREKDKAMLADKQSGIEDNVSKFKTQLLDLIALKKEYGPDHEFSVMIDKFVYKKYTKIAYLFKSADYEYEHEVRVMKYVPRNSDTIKFYPIENKAKPGRLYVQSVNPVYPFIEKIYLGPKVQDSSHWSLYLDYQAKQRQNEYKLDKMPWYDVRKGSIEIVKSKNEFV